MDSSAFSQVERLIVEGQSVFGKRDAVFAWRPCGPGDRTEKPFTFPPREVFDNGFAGQLRLRALAGLGLPGEFGVEALGQPDADERHDTPYCVT